MMTTNRCKQCGTALTPRQVNNQNECCSPRCARMWKASAPRYCPACGGAVATGKKYCNQRCRRAWEGRRAPDSAPAPIARPEPAQRVTGHPGEVLGREGQTVYRVGELNARLYVFDTRGVYCPLAQWATSTAARRLAKQGERSVFDEVKVASAWRKHYAREVTE